MTKTTKSGIQHYNVFDVTVVEGKRNRKPTSRYNNANTKEGSDSRPDSSADEIFPQKVSSSLKPKPVKQCDLSGKEAIGRFDETLGVDGERGVTIIHKYLTRAKGAILSPVVKCSNLEETPNSKPRTSTTYISSSGKRTHKREVWMKFDNQCDETVLFIAPNNELIWDKHELDLYVKRNGAIVETNIVDFQSRKGGGSESNTTTFCVPKKRSNVSPTTVVSKVSRRCKRRKVIIAKSKHEYGGVMDKCEEKSSPPKLHAIELDMSNLCGGDSGFNTSNDSNSLSPKTENSYNESPCFKTDILKIESLNVEGDLNHSPSCSHKTLPFPEFVEERPGLKYRQMLVITMFHMPNRGGFFRDIFRSITYLFPYYGQKKKSKKSVICSAIRYNLSAHSEFVRLSSFTDHSQAKFAQFFLAHNIESMPIFDSIRSYVSTTKEMTSTSNDINVAVVAQFMEMTRFEDDIFHKREMEAEKSSSVTCSLEEYLQLSPSRKSTSSYFDIIGLDSRSVNGKLVNERRLGVTKELTSTTTAIGWNEHDDDLCYVCGSTCDSATSFIYCRMCCHPFHPFCLALTDLPQSHGEEVMRWSCPGCRPCFICGVSSLSSEEEGADSKTANFTLKVTCCMCAKCAHVSCLCREGGGLLPTFSSSNFIQVDSITGFWTCADCSRCVSCGLKGNGTRGLKSSDGGGIDMCKECELRFGRQQFCPLCQTPYDNDDYDSKMMECSRCNRWVHASCEGISTEDQYQVLSHLPNSIEYVCRSMMASLRSDFRSIESWNSQLMMGMGSSVFEDISVSPPPPPYSSLVPPPPSCLIFARKSNVIPRKD